MVVYKVDRLTRSLTDFAKLVELFDRHGVSFVSITQSFNTTTSMGRLTLNVLLSFAQFEREVIGERVRDKIAASKRKGLWMGGPVPLGYASVNKKLVIAEDEAETVRTIFRRYLELGSIQALADDLDRRGIITKSRVWSNGRTVGGVRFGVGPLAYLLKNRVYIGEVVHRHEIHAGDHLAILDRDLFEAVQTKLASKAVDRTLRLKGSPSLLTGLIFDGVGNKMRPSHTNKQGVRYRYYVSQAALCDRDSDACGMTRIPAPDIETLVLDCLRSHYGSKNNVDDRALIERYAAKVVVRRDTVEIHPKAPDDGVDGGGGVDTAGPPFLLAWARTGRACVKGLTSSPDQSPGEIESRESLLSAIAKARLWLNEIIEGNVKSFTEIAQREDRGERYIRMLVTLAFVSSELLDAILDGRARMTPVTTLVQTLPCSWKEQALMFVICPAS